MRGGGPDVCQPGGQLQVLVSARLHGAGGRLC